MFGTFALQKYQRLTKMSHDEMIFPDGNIEMEEVEVSATHNGEGQGTGHAVSPSTVQGFYLS